MLPDHTWAHGLWEEPPSWRQWQAHLDSLQLPEPDRVDCPESVVLYSDGSCLNPRCPHSALASGAVIHASPDGSYSVVWAGQLPGSYQTPFRAELLAGAVAFTSFTRLHLFSDCKAFVKVASRLLQAAQEGRSPALPSEHRDLWGMFWLGLVCLGHPPGTVLSLGSPLTKITGACKVCRGFMPGSITVLAK